MFFTTTKEEIQRLNDEQARELVARLCQAEVLKNGHDTSLVTWGGDQRAADGGVDVRVTFPVNSQHTSDWLLRSENIAIQVKAVQKFSTSHISDEMTSHSSLLQSLAGNGSYIIVSTKSNVADKSLTANCAAMRDILNQLNVTNVKTDFYDARRIADWVNEHPSVFIWVKAILGSSISGWKPFGAWAYHESDVTSEYILDDEAKLITPTGKTVLILDGINVLRQALRQADAVRLVGLSGVGKTRLVQALFDKRIETAESCLEKEFVIYGDVSDPLEPQPQSMLASLLTKKSRTILVVDNCGSELHNNLTKLLTEHLNNEISLLTVEYDIREDLPDHTACYRLDSSSNSVIEKFIKTKFHYLSSLDMQKIVEFSDGNARVAYALADTAQRSGELAQLKNNELFERLFYQRHDPNNRDLLISAKYASLVYSFNADNDELEILAQLSEQTAKTFRASLSELARRGLLQSRGCWRAVLPHAIANNLTKLLSDDLGKTELVRIFTNENKRFVRSFSRRLGYLHESTIAQDLVKDLLAPSGMFYLLESLSDDEQAMVTNLASVAPDAMLGCLEAAVSRGAFSAQAASNDDWNNLLIKLAYDSALFERSVRLLINPCFNGLDKVKHLFTLVLSGTEAIPQQRFALLKEWLHSSDEQLQKLGFSCLSESFRFGTFSSAMSFDFGARKRTYGWEPKTNHDYCVWYRPLLILMDELYRENKYKDEIRGLFLSSFSNLWQMRVLQEDLERFFYAFAESSIWLESFVMVKDILYFQKEELNVDEKASLEKLLTIVEPKTDFDKLSLLLCSERPFKARDISYQEQIQQIKETAMHWANNPQWLDLLPCLLSDKAHHVYQFGYGVACAYEDMESLLNTIKTTLLVEDNRPSLSFVHGLISGWHDTHPEAVEAFLSASMIDNFWTQYVVSLQLSIKPYDANIAYARLLEKAQNTTTSYELVAFKNLVSGCRLQDYSTDQLLALSKVLMLKPSGLSVVLDIWYMAVFCARDKDSDYQAELKLSAQHLLEQLNWSAIEKYGNDGHHLLDVMDYAYHDLGANEQIEKTIQHFVEHMIVSDWTVSSALANYLFYFMERFPQATLDNLYAQQTHENFKRVISTLTSGFVRQERSFNYDVEVIMSWCQGEHQKLMLIASMFRLFKIKGDTFVDEDSSLIEPVALALLRAASMHRDVLEKVFESFSPNHWSGSRANIMEMRMQLFDGVDLSSHPELHSFWLERRVLIADWINEDRQQEQERHKRESETFE